MEDRFPRKYRSESLRKPNWSYDSSGLYFITLICKNHNRHLGEILNGKMILSPFGEIVKKEWEKSFIIRKNITLDEFVIMPNHLHAIVALQNNVDSKQIINPKKEFKRLPNSISTFIGGYKSAVNTKIDDYIDLHCLNIPKYNRNNHFFVPDYWDNIIQDIEAYHKIKTYIINNPKNWHKDRFSK